MPIFGFTNPSSGSPIVYGGALSFQPTNPNSPYSHVYKSEQIVVQPTGTHYYYEILNNKFKVDPSGWSS